MTPGTKKWLTYGGLGLGALLVIYLLYKYMGSSSAATAAPSTTDLGGLGGVTLGTPTAMGGAFQPFASTATTTTTTPAPVVPLEPIVTAPILTPGTGPQAPVTTTTAPTAAPTSSYTGLIGWRSQLSNIIIHPVVGEVGTGMGGGSLLHTQTF